MDLCYNKASKRGDITQFNKEEHLDSLTLARHIVDVLEEHKAQDIVLLDLRPETVVADFFVICTGTTDRQLKGLIDHVRVGVKERFEELPFAVEGIAESGWVLMDYSEVVVHMFMEQKREYYDLEGLWSAESTVLLSIQ